MGSVSREPIWRVGDVEIDCGERTLVMGILNVTPDSFSDGGLYLDHGAAVIRGIEMVDEGADLIDVGGESTRPGSDPVSPEEERDRVVPVIETLAAKVPVPISVDTRKPAVAGAALDAGALIVNDISGARDPEMFAVVREAGAGMVLMHMKGEPKTMQVAPHYDDVVGEVHEYLRERIEAAEFAGIAPERLCVDPGIGFGKDLHQNLTLMHHVDALLDLGRPLLVGPSRKRFIGALLDLPEDERVEGTAGAVAWLVGRGAHIARVHDVKQMVRVVRVVDAIARAGR
ncbi:MAG: dihydropteroate synthase [Actinobacteria bacterium]|nr:MAG: dihydropteroate synthase [Actinomycetota bacterium]